jgi:hypothetical protein
MAWPFALLVRPERARCLRKRPDEVCAARGELAVHTRRREQAVDDRMGRSHMSFVATLDA